MKDIATYVGVDAHKKDLFIATLVGDHPTPVTWQVANEPNAVRLVDDNYHGRACCLTKECYPW